MTARRLLIRPPASGRGFSTEEFVWRRGHGQSSFHTNVDPELRNLGAVPLPNRDLVAVATGVFLADRTIKRPRSWEREIELEVPVYDPDRWNSVTALLATTLEVLSSDQWTLSPVQRPKDDLSTVASRPEVDRVLLFSGGADSLCGAVRSLANGERLLLVSHWDWTGHSAVQKQLAGWLARRFPKQVYQWRINLGRRETQLGGGTFGNEVTRRTRSLLFLSLGLASAAIEPAVPLWIAENGFAALNPPLAGERRGALSTRTTHPLVLSELQRAVEDVGGYHELNNPFESLTKGQMYSEVAHSLGGQDAEAILAMSHSCSHVRYAAGTGYPPATQCGVCFGCLVRRAAFLAAGLDDSTTYLNEAIARENQPRHLRTTADAEVRTVRYAGHRGVTAADLLAMGLPDDLALDDALDVAQRGLRELADVVDAEPDLVSISS
jgi:hypothetical protein